MALRNNAGEKDFKCIIKTFTDRNYDSRYLLSAGKDPVENTSLISISSRYIEEVYFSLAQGYNLDNSKESKFTK